MAGYSRRWTCELCGHRQESVDYPRVDVCDVCAHKAVRHFMPGPSIALQGALEKAYVSGYERGKAERPNPASTPEGEYARNQQEAVEHIRTLPPSERSAVANRPGQAPPSTQQNTSGGEA